MLHRRKFLQATAMGALLATVPSLVGAWPVRGNSLGAFNNGRSQVNFNFLNGGGEFPFINLLKTAPAWSWVDNNGTQALTPDLFDTDGYPTSIVHSGVFTLVYIPSQSEYAGDYILDWSGSGTVACAVNKGTGSVTTVSGGPTSSPWRFSLTGATQLKVSITAIGSPRVTNMRLYNANDAAAQSLGEIFGTKFLQRLQQANIGVLRFLNWQNQNISNVSAWDNGQRPESYYQYNSSQWRSDLLCNLAGSGITSNSGADYSVSAPSAWVTSGGKPADKSMVHVVWNASSPTSGTVSFAGGGSPNITWTSHGLSNNNQVYFTGGTVPPEITASVLGTFPITSYFVTVIDINTINVAVTEGGSVINCSTTGSGTITGRTNVTLNVGSTAKIPLLSSFANNLTASGNGFPIGGSVNSLATLVYDAAMDAWMSFGGAIGAAGIQNMVPLSVCLKLAKRIGAHPWFTSPMMTCTPMSDWHSQVAALCRDYTASNAPWMIPRIEPPNELWNTAFYATGYANAISQFYGWGADLANWYGKAASTIGQAWAAAYGIAKVNVKTQTKYQVICAMQTSSCATPTAATNSNGARLTSTKYVLQSPQSGYLAEAASGWVTHVCCANYFAPGYYGRNQEVVLANSYYVTNAGNPTAQAANAATYEATDSGGGVCTFNNGSPGSVTLTGNNLFSGQVVSFVSTGNLPTGINTGNYWVNATGDTFTLSSTDLYNGSATAVNISGTPTGIAYCITGQFTLEAVMTYATNCAALGAANGVNKITFYEGGYSPDYSTSGVTATITAASIASQCVLTIPTTTVQSIRSPAAQQNTTNPAASAGQYLKLSEFTGDFAAYNNTTVQVVSVNGADGRLVTINLDTTGKTFSGTGTATFVADAAGNIPMSTALNALRLAGKSAPNLQSSLASNYGSLTSITGGEFPSCFQMGGAPTSSNVWSVLENIYVSGNPPQWAGIAAFNA